MWIPVVQIGMRVHPSMNVEAERALALCADAAGPIHAFGQLSHLRVVEMK